MLSRHILSNSLLRTTEVFAERQTLKFAKPDGQKAGSGLTLIVGPNNSGKTSVLSALAFTDHTTNKRFTAYDRHAGQLPTIKLVWCDDTWERWAKFSGVQGSSTVSDSYKEGTDSSNTRPAR